MIRIFDTHAHYDDEAFDEDREELLQGLPGQGIARVVNVGSSLASCRRTIALMEAYDFIYGAIGIHPSETAQLEVWEKQDFPQESRVFPETLTSGATQDPLEWLEQQCHHPKCVAVGEIGLDYYWDEPARDIQKKWFLWQLHLARRLDLPVIIHSREAAQDTLDILQAEKAGDIGGVIHCYSYTKESARTYLDMGFFFGIGGVLTFQNARKLKEAVEYIPMDRIVLETDCPYLAPVPYRGKRNSSLNLPYVVQAMAQVKGIPEDEVMKAAWDNGLRLYRMKKQADSQ